MIAIPFFILLPVFFNLESGLFRDPAMVYDSGGVLSRLPLPVSVLVCLAGLLLLGRRRGARLSVFFIFVSFIMMSAAALFSARDGVEGVRAKSLLLLQFVLPMTALALGQLYEALGEDALAMHKGFLVVIVTVVPLQLLSTWRHGTFYLYPNVYLFSIYQHLQYVPVIFVSAYLVTFCGLWQRPSFRIPLLILLPAMGIYALLSNSISTLLLLFAGVAGLVISSCKHRKVVACAMVIPFLLFAIHARKDVSGRLSFEKHIATMSKAEGPLETQRADQAAQNAISVLEKSDLPNISARFFYWQYHLSQSLSSAKAFMFGNGHRPDRQKMPSAHNYYIDLLYNFGFISLLPLFALIGVTVVRLYHRRIRVLASPELSCLAFVVMFLLIVDNSFKLGLRQPYPGIFTFFIWGMLLSRLRELPE